LSFWFNGPSIKAPQIPLGQQKQSIWRCFIEFGGTKKCCTFSGLELVPESRKKANWRSQLHAQRSTMYSNPLGPSEKILFLENDNECAICVIHRDKPHLRAFPEAKKGVARAEVR